MAGLMAEPMAESMAVWKDKNSADKLAASKVEMLVELRVVLLAG